MSDDFDKNTDDLSWLGDFDPDDGDGSESEQEEDIPSSLSSSDEGDDVVHTGLTDLFPDEDDENDAPPSIGAAGIERPGDFEAEVVPTGITDMFGDEYDDDDEYIPPSAGESEDSDSVVRPPVGLTDGFEDEEYDDESGTIPPSAGDTGYLAPISGEIDSEDHPSSGLTYLFDDGEDGEESDSIPPSVGDTGYFAPRPGEFDDEVASDDLPLSVGDYELDDDELFPIGLTTMNLDGEATPSDDLSLPISEHDTEEDIQYPPSGLTGLFDDDDELEDDGPLSASDLTEDDAPLSVGLTYMFDDDDDDLLSIIDEHESAESATTPTDEFAATGITDEIDEEVPEPLADVFSAQREASKAGSITDDLTDELLTDDEVDEAFYEQEFPPSILQSQGDGESLEDYQSTGITDMFGAEDDETVESVASMRSEYDEEDRAPSGLTYMFDDEDDDATLSPSVLNTDSFREGDLGSGDVPVTGITESLTDETIAEDDDDLLAIIDERESAEFEARSGEALTGITDEFEDKPEPPLAEVFDAQAEQSSDGDSITDNLDTLFDYEDDDLADDLFGDITPQDDSEALSDLVETGPLGATGQQDVERRGIIDVGDRPPTGLTDLFGTFEDDDDEDDIEYLEFIAQEDDDSLPTPIQTALLSPEELEPTDLRPGEMDRDAAPTGLTDLFDDDEEPIDEPLPDSVTGMLDSALDDFEDDIPDNVYSGGLTDLFDGGDDDEPPYPSGGLADPVDDDDDQPLPLSVTSMLDDALSDFDDPQETYVAGLTDLFDDDDEEKTIIDPVVPSSATDFLDAALEDAERSGELAAQDIGLTDLFEDADDDYYNAAPSDLPDFLEDVFKDLDDQYDLSGDGGTDLLRELQADFPSEFDEEDILSTDSLDYSDFPGPYDAPDRTGITDEITQIEDDDRRRGELDSGGTGITDRFNQQVDDEDDLFIDDIDQAARPEIEEPPLPESGFLDVIVDLEEGELDLSFLDDNKDDIFDEPLADTDDFVTLDDFLDDIDADFDTLNLPQTDIMAENVDELFDEYDEPYSTRIDDGEYTPEGELPEGAEGFLADVSVGGNSATAILRGMDNLELDDPQLIELSQRAAKLQRSSGTSDAGILSNLVPGLTYGLQPATIDTESDAITDDVRLSDDEQKRVNTLRGLIASEDDARIRHGLTATSDVVDDDRPEIDDFGDVDEVEDSAPLAVRPRRRRRPLMRLGLLLVALLITSVVALPYFFDDFSSFFAVVGEPSRMFDPDEADAAAVFENIGSLQPADIVLFAIDYQPGASAEMNEVAEAMIRHSLIRGGVPVVVTTNPLGIPRAETLFANLAEDEAFRELTGRDMAYGEDYYIISQVVGGAVGISQLVQNPQDFVATNSRGDESGVILPENSLDGFELIVIVSDRVDVVRTWVEQVAPRTERQVIAGVAEAAEPAARQYARVRDGLGGLLVGLDDATRYNALVVDTVADNPNYVVVVQSILPTATNTFTPTFTPSPTNTLTPIGFVPSDTPEGFVPTQAPGDFIEPPREYPLGSVLINRQTNTINIRSAPNLNSSVVAAVPPGFGLRTQGDLSSDGEWLFVILLDNTSEGWVSVDLIERVEPAEIAFLITQAALSPTATFTETLTSTATFTATFTFTPSLTTTTDATAIVQGTLGATQQTIVPPTATLTDTPEGTPPDFVAPSNTFTPTFTLTPSATITPTDVESPTTTFTVTASVTSSATTVPELTDTPTITVSPSNTPTPSSTPLLLDMETVVRTSSRTAINARSGPGTDFDRIGVLAPDTLLIVRGNSPDGLWIQTILPVTDEVAWVFRDLTTVDPDADFPTAVPTLPPPTATFTVTNTATLIPTATAIPLDSEGLLARVISIRPLNVRTGPGRGYRVILPLSPQTVVNVLGASETPRWLRIQLPDGLVGYIYEPAVELIPAEMFDVQLTQTAESAIALGTQNVPAPATQTMEAIAAAASPTLYPEGTFASVAGFEIVNVRAEPDFSAPIIGTVGPLETITALSLSPDGRWVQVRILGFAEGWVSRSLVQVTIPETASAHNLVPIVMRPLPQSRAFSRMGVAESVRFAPVAQTGSEGSGRIISTGLTNVREEPNLQSPIVGLVQRDDIVPVLNFDTSADGTSWTLIRTEDDEEGYIQSINIVVETFPVLPTATPTPTETPLPEGAPREGSGRITAEDFVIVRQGPSLRRSAVGEVAPDTVVPVLDLIEGDDESTWVEIRLDVVDDENGIEGFIQASLIAIDEFPIRGTEEEPTPTEASGMRTIVSREGEGSGEINSSQPVSVFASPDTTSDVLTTLNSGDVIPLSNFAQGGGITWIQIRLEDDSVGYVESRSVTILVFPSPQTAQEETPTLEDEATATATVEPTATLTETEVQATPMPTDEPTATLTPTEEAATATTTDTPATATATPTLGDQQQGDGVLVIPVQPVAEVAGDDLVTIYSSDESLSNVIGDLLPDVEVLALGETINRLDEQWVEILVPMVGQRGWVPAESLTITGNPAEFNRPLVTVNGTNPPSVFIEPNVESEMITLLGPGTAVVAFERSDDGAWVRVRVPDGRVGWLRIVPDVALTGNFDGDVFPTINFTRENETAVVRRLPDIEVDQVGALSPDINVDVRALEPDLMWYEVRLPDGTRGWIQASDGLDINGTYTSATVVEIPVDTETPTAEATVIVQVPTDSPTPAEVAETDTPTLEATATPTPTATEMADTPTPTATPDLLNISLEDQQRYVSIRGGIAAAVVIILLGTFINIGQGIRRERKRRRQD